MIRSLTTHRLRVLAGLAAASIAALALLISSSAGDASSTAAVRPAKLISGIGRHRPVFVRAKLYAHGVPHRGDQHRLRVVVPSQKAFAATRAASDGGRLSLTPARSTTTHHIRVIKPRKRS